MSLTPDELAVVRRIGEAFTAFHALPAMHPADHAEFVFHIHALQNIVMVRSAVRCHPDHFLIGHLRKE